LCDLDAPVKGSKSTLRQNLLQAKKSGAKTPQLQLPKYPKAFRHLVEWAKDLQGKDPLTFSEIKAWADLMHLQLNPWEVEIIMRLDTIYHVRISKALE